ncbi:patatin-like phospholipase family protein [Nocardioides sp. JQ2195]|uniref:patatin-like phospholipase family protein n=1 Tax=Nocardioides sp. JQ2195 TaxID=2592334 RepID=UPI00143E7952|nr:patatin-like phospholipase family protein [Nocardioides sp. JQ2195]QIX27514.1 patatin-like phospholipase family protein [Nocardioides sp. JQ2195]
MVTAFVFSGGGSLGAVQVGALRALTQRGITPDLLVGTSAGSLNAAFVAIHGTREPALLELERLWTGLHRRDVFPLQPARGLMAVLGRSPSVFSPAPLARFLRAQLGEATFDGTAIDLHVVTADVLSGETVLISDGSVAEALLASCAIPGVHPPVLRGTRWLCDGAVANDSGISQAIALGAHHVYLIPGGTSCALARPETHPVGAALHALTLLLHQRALLETQLFSTATDLHVLPPLCPLHVSSADFSRAEYLIERSAAATGRWLDEGMDQLPGSRVLSLHTHPEAISPEEISACASRADGPTARSGCPRSRTPRAGDAR